MHTYFLLTVFIVDSPIVSTGTPNSGIETVLYP